MSDNALLEKNATLLLEKETAAFIDQLKASGGKAIYQLTPTEARSVLEKLQTGKVTMPKVTIEEKTIAAGPKGSLTIHIVRPMGSKEKLPIVMYFHGAGWVMGSFKTHERLISELAIGANAAVVFVNYSRSPEVEFPVAIEESYAATQYVAKNSAEFNLDSSRLAIAGDSVGGNMAIAVTFLTKERQGAPIQCQVLFYPVTSSELNTASYKLYAEGPWLTKPAMEWFWNAYEPDVKARKMPLLSPLKATNEQLKDLPPALVITAENDVLRDEGEAYAHHLMQAGVEVIAMRYLGTIHDFVLLNALAKTPATRSAIFLANSYLQKALDT